MVDKLRRIKCKITHKHYALIVTHSSVGCAVVSIGWPQYNAICIVLAALTNVVWVWGDHNV